MVEPKKISGVYQRNQQTNHVSERQTRFLGDTSSNAELIAAFGHRFRTQHWPIGHAQPEVYFDPRSLALEPHERAVLHAKCVVRDGRVAFVSSAISRMRRMSGTSKLDPNTFICSHFVAERLMSFFTGLISTGRVRLAF